MLSSHTTACTYPDRNSYFQPHLSIPITLTMARSYNLRRRSNPAVPGTSRSNVPLSMHYLYGGITYILPFTNDKQHDKWMALQDKLTDAITELSSYPTNEASQRVRNAKFTYMITALTIKSQFSRKHVFLPQQALVNQFQREEGQRLTRWI